MSDTSNWFLLTASDAGQASEQSGGSPVDPNAQDVELLDAYSRAVISVVEAVSPAVISVTGRNEGRPSGSGSGFIISPDGYAITNSHVVAGRSQLLATTHEGDRLLTDVVGDDPSTDVALLRLAAGELPYAQIGDSETLRVGQLVIAMGSPLGLQSTVSTGIVSAVGRSLRGQDGRLIEHIVQHTAPINPGNSGGPLLDSRGRVVGVNTAIIAMAQGLGFAVPSKTIQWVATELMGHGKVRRRQLGIVATVAKLSRALVRELDLLSEQAVAVIEVTPGSAAHQAGVRADDLIVAVNGRIVANVDDLHRILTQLPRELALEVTVIRDGVQRTIQIG